MSKILIDEATVKLALDALENSIDLVSQEARNAEELYGKYPTRLARIQGLVAFEVAHEKAITVLKALAEKQAQQATVGLPESETEEMHDAVMEVLYQGGVTRGNTYLLWQAYRKVLAATPQAQRKPLTPTLEADTGYSRAQRAAFEEGWQEAEAAHGIKENT